MAAVNIGPRIGIEGEAEYRRQMQNIIQQTKTYQSAVKEAESALGKNASAQDKAASKAKALTKAIEAQRQQVEYCQAMLNASKEKYGENATQTLKWEQALHKANTELNKMNQELAQTNPLKAWGEDVVAAGKKIEETGQKISSAGQTMTRYVTAPIVGGAAAAVKASIDYESAFTGVMKTVDETATTTYDDISNAIKEMSTRTASSKEEIAGVAEAAGQLGVDADHLTKFTEVMIQLGDTTNLSADAAAISLAKFSNITGDSLDDVDRLGASIVDLGNNFATDEASIVSMATRLASAGTIAGLSSTDILALAASMSSVGIEAEAGGTAMSQTLTKIGAKVSDFRDGTEDALDTLATTSGMSAEQFAATWEANPIEAIQTFITGLDKANESGENVNAILDDLGMTGIRQSNMLKAMALASGNMSKAIDVSSTAYKKNTALVNEANKRYQTTAAKLSQVKEKASNVGIEFGNVMLPVVEKAIDKAGAFADKLMTMSDGEKAAVIQTAALAAAVGPVLVATGKTITAVGQITQVVGKAAIKIGEIQTAMEAAGGAGEFFAAGLGSTAGTVTLVAAPLAILAKVFYDAGKEARQATAEQTAFAQKCSEVAEAANAAAAEVEGVGSGIEQNAASFQTAGADVAYFRDMLNDCYDSEGNLKEGMVATAEYALNQLNQAMGTDYSTEFISQAEDSKAALEEINGAIEQNIAMLKKQALSQAFQSDYTAALKAQTTAHSALTDAEKVYTDAVQRQKDAQKEVIDAMKAKNATTEEGTERQQEATTAFNEANEALKQAGEAYKTAAGAAAEADTQVSGLDETMKLLADGTPEGIEKAAEAYGNIGTNATKAGEEASAAAEKIVTSAQDAADRAAQKAQDSFDRNKFTGHVDKVDGGDAAAKASHSKMNTTISKPMQGKVDKVNGGNTAATSAKSGMNTIIKAPMQGRVNQVTGGPSAASAAKGQMSPIIASPMAGRVGSVTNAVSAASSAHAQAQSYFSNNPFRATINIVQNVQRVVSEIVQKLPGHAEGGFVNQEQLSWLAEGNKPEVVIPLDSSKRKRAIDLYKRTGAYLATDTAFLPSLGGGSGSVSYGGINVTINAAEGQSEQVIADLVIDRIQTDLGRRAVYG